MNQEDLNNDFQGKLKELNNRYQQESDELYQQFLGKSFDSFAPVGPYFVTADEVGDPNNLSIETRLNGHVMQASNTSCFIFCSFRNFFSEIR